jgi:hypothetical protein
MLGLLLHIRYKTYSRANTQNEHTLCQRVECACVPHLGLARKTTLNNIDDISRGHSRGFVAAEKSKGRHGQINSRWNGKMGMSGVLLSAQHFR